jgi:transposase
MLSDEQKERIIHLKGLNWTWNNIALAMNKKKEARRSFYRKYELLKSLPPKPKIRNSKITGAIGLKIKKEVRANPRISVRKLMTVVNTDIDDKKGQISKSTIHNYLTENGFVCRNVIARPILREANILKRFEFGKYVQEQLAKEELFLTKILWSIETMISCYPHKRKMVVRVHYSVDNANLPLNPAVQGGGFNVMFFGSFSSRAFGPLTVIDGKIDAKKYIENIKELIEPELKASKVPLIFMQDNAPCHKAKVVMDYLRKKRIKTLDWPPQSPDLNPIEHIWVIMKDILYKEKDFPKNRDELIDRVFLIWKNLDKKLLQTLTKHAKKRFEDVVAYKGHWLGSN